MNFDFSDDQHAIKRTAKDLLADRFKMERVRELAEAGEYDEGVWNELCELGWAGIFIDESYGGQGLGIVELIILMEELGYALAPLPFLSNAAAGLVLQAAGSDEQKERWLPGIASGELRGTVGLVTDGEAKLVPDAATAEVIVLCGHEGTEVVERSDAPRSSRSGPWIPLAPSRASARAAPAGRSRATTCAGSRLRRSRPGRGAHRRLAAGHGDGSRIRARPQAVRPGDRGLPGRIAPLRSDADGGRGRPLGDLLRRAWTADAEPESLALAGCHGEGLRLRRRLAGVHVVAAGARRDRLHLGARPALLPEAGQGRRRSSTAPRASTETHVRGPVGSRASRSSVG